ncbi:hypothetical protein EJB05_10758 [Eragrostis curvula]|uniref:Uncharacterized protein n=1 Tax=Eragrostis curvula TaxID=38414 RepID=A0A5J9VMQ7_9POAL|nr:hypothetical protein EJB05_10758 [Eragrostis curvula]
MKAAGTCDIAQSLHLADEAPQYTRAICRRQPSIWLRRRRSLEGKAGRARRKILAQTGPFKSVSKDVYVRTRNKGRDGYAIFENCNSIYIVVDMASASRYWSASTRSRPNPRQILTAHWLPRLPRLSPIVTSQVYHGGPHRR